MLADSSRAQLERLAASCANASVLNVDAGFHKGTVSASWFSDAAVPSLCVLAFEPNPTLVPIAALQPFAQRLHVERAAVGDADATATLWYGDERVMPVRDPKRIARMRPDQGTLHTELGRYHAGVSAGGTRHRVAVVRMEPHLRLLRSLLPRSVSWGQLKTDVQGHDLPALLGAGPLIERFQCVSMEVWGATLVGRRYVSPVPHMASRGFVLVPPLNRRTGQPHNLTRGNFGQLNGVRFLNRRHLRRFAADGSRSWPAFCEVPDARVSADAVREAARAALSAADATNPDTGGRGRERRGGLRGGGRRTGAGH